MSRIRQAPTTNGIIAPVYHSSSYISALLIVAKQNGGIRICIDPKPLNKTLERDHFCMPTIDDVLPKLANANVFSAFDAKSAFWHCKLNDESVNLYTFVRDVYRQMKFFAFTVRVRLAPKTF